MSPARSSSRRGSAINDFMHPDRVVIGDDGHPAGDEVAALYEPLGAPIVRTDIASAEMIKLAANAFLATKISFINEIANVCEELDANVLDVAVGIGLDDRIGPQFLQAGIGYGGSCFTKDVSALKLLAANSGYHFQLLSSVIEVNELQKRRVVAKLQRHLGDLAGRRIALLGLAFKPNTDDMRGASSLVLASRLEAEGAIVRSYDPVAEAEARQSHAATGLCRLVARSHRGGRRGRPRHRMARVPRARLAARRGGDVRDGSSSTAATRSIRTSFAPRDSSTRASGARERPSTGSVMQALILAGGVGTRLRPLTARVPKPVVTLVDRPFIAFMLEWLHGHGIDEVILSCGFLAASVREVLGDGVRLRRPSPLRRRARAARHGRRPQVRGRSSRRALRRLQWRHLDGPRPLGSDRPAREHRRGRRRSRWRASRTRAPTGSSSSRPTGTSAPSSRSPPATIGPRSR